MGGRLPKKNKKELDQTNWYFADGREKSFDGDGSGGGVETARRQCVFV